MPSLLTLPRFHPALPIAPTIDEGQDTVKVFAASLVHAGILRAEHLDAHPRSLPAAMDAATQQWLTPYHAQLQIFGTVACGYTPTLTLPGDQDCSPDLRHQKPAAFFVSNDDVPRESYYIGPFATALQRHTPGLGHELMKLLHIAGTHGIGLYDPHMAYGEAQHHFWMGETDIAEVADGYRHHEEDKRLLESGTEPPTDEQILELNDIPTPTQFFRIYPEWAVEFPGSPGYRPGKVPNFPTTLRGRYRPAMAAANDLADHLRFVRRRWLVNSNRNDDTFPNDARRIWSVHTGAAAPILLRWSSKDWHVRLLDDSFEEIMQESADYNLTGIVCFDPQDDADCRDARARFEALLTTGILTDRLLRLTTTTDEHS